MSGMFGEAEVNYFKNNDRNKLLLTAFVICCALLAWIVGDLIVHAR